MALWLIRHVLKTSLQIGLKDLSAGRFAPIDPPLGMRSVVLEDSTDTVAPPRVHFEEKPEKTVKIENAFRTASVVHDDARDLWGPRDWESPVMDMTPTVTSHFGAFAVDEDAIVERVTEDCADVFEDAMAAEVVSDLPPETFVEDFVYRPEGRTSNVDKFYKTALQILVRVPDVYPTCTRHVPGTCTLHVPNVYRACTQRVPDVYLKNV